MSLNIKNQQAHKLAQALAERTGETMTSAVTRALQERLERVRGGRKTRAEVDDILAIGRKCAATLKGKPKDHGELLYDQRGLPK